MVKNAKKSLWIARAALLALVFGLLLGLSAAAATPIRVFDGANLFTQQEKADLAAAIAGLEQKWGNDIVIATTGNARGMSAEKYAETLYDQYGFGKANGKKGGVLYLIDMDNREAFIFRADDAMYYFTDERVSSMLDAVFERLGAGQYAASASVFLKQVDTYFTAGVPKGQHNYDVETGEVTPYKSLTPIEMAMSGLAGLLGGAGVAGGVSGRYKRVGETPAYELGRMGRLNLGVQQDRYYDRQLTSLYSPVPRYTGTGGGGGSGGFTPGRSSGHWSSGGGGGGSFRGGMGRKF